MSTKGKLLIFDPNALYLIACYECRIFGGLSLYDKMEDELFHIISQFTLTPKFKFPAKHPVFKIRADGLKVRCPPARISTNKYKHGTIQFGKFLNSSHKFIYRVTFKLKAYNDDNRGCYLGLGFLKPKFNEYDNGINWNQGGNHSVIAYECKPYKNDEFKKVSINKKYWYKIHDQIIYEMNMIKLKAKVWSKLNHNDTKPMIIMDLDYDDIAIAFSIGCFDQTVTVIDQQFIFPE